MTRTWLALFLGNSLLVQVVSYALRPAISYELLDRGGTSVWLGIAGGCFALPPLLLAIWVGRLADRRGERFTMIWGAAALVVAALISVLPGTGLVGLLLATAFLGIGVLFSVVGEQTLVMRRARNSGLDFSFGIYTFAMSAGQMLGPLLLLIPGDHPGTPSFAWVSWVSLAAGAAVLLLSVLTPGGGPPENGIAASRGGLHEIGGLLRRGGVVPALIASSLVLSSLDVVLAYLPLYARERLLSAAWVSAILVARGTCTMLSRLLLSRLTGWFGRRNVLLWGSVIAAVALGSTVVPMPPVLLFAAMCLYGLAAGTVQPLTMSWVTLVTPPRQRGLAVSLRLLGNRAGQTVIPLAAAAFSTFGGAAMVFGVTGGTLVISGVLSRRAPNGEESPYDPETSEPS